MWLKKQILESAHERKVGEQIHCGIGNILLFLIFLWLLLLIMCNQKGHASPT